MKNKILIRRPSKSFGNVGDIALIETIKKEFKTKSIVYDIPDVNEINIKNVDEYECLVYFGNDCIAYWSISESLIMKFLQSGKDVHIINTSYGKNPKNKFIDKITEHTNLHMYIRDKHSLQLLTEKFNFYNKPILVADLAHLCRPSTEPKDEKLENWIVSSDKKIVGINIHNDFGKDNKKVFDSVKTFICDYRNTYRFLFIPHDSRKNENKLMLKLVKGLDGVDYYSCGCLDAEYEKHITKNFYFVITGRMHLAILTLPNKVPCITIDYAGLKALGSLSHWGMEDFALSSSDIEETLSGKIKELLSNYEEIIRELGRRYESVMLLAKKQLNKIGD